MGLGRSLSALALCAVGVCACAQQLGADQLNKLRRPADRPLHESPGLDLLNQILKGQTITMDNAIQIALAINIPLAEAKANLDIAEGRTQEAYSALNPTLGAILTGLRYNEEQTTTTLISANPTNLNFPIGARVATENLQQTLVEIGANLPIDISGMLNASGEQQKYLRVQAQYAVNQTENDVVTNVKTAFYSVLRARALRTVAEDNLRNAQVRYTDAQNKYAAQVVTKFDVLRSQVDVENAEQELISARNQVESLYAQLNRVIGIKVNTRLHVVETGAVHEPSPLTPPGGMPAPVPTPSQTVPSAPSALPNPATPSAPTPKPQATPPGSATSTPPTANTPPKPYSPANPPSTGANDQPNATAKSVLQRPGGSAQMPGGQAPGVAESAHVPTSAAVLGPDFDGDLKEALQNRPEMGAAKAGISSSQWGVRYAQRSELPSANLSWDYLYAPNAPGLHPYTHSWLLTGQIGIPIFDGGLAAARMKEARGEVANSTSLLRDTEDQVTLEVEQALFAVQDARDRVRVANQTLAEAQEAFAIAQRRYNASVSPLIELSDAQDALTQAESNQVNALYDYNTAETELDRALGRYSNYGPQPIK